MNVINPGVRSYATRENAIRALDKVAGTDRPNVRWLIAVNSDNPPRYVPVVIGAEHLLLAHVGIMVVG